MKGQGDRGVGGGGGGGGVSLVRAGEREYRERLRHKDLEIAEQLDKIEVYSCTLYSSYSLLSKDRWMTTSLMPTLNVQDLLNVRDDLERQRQELTEELGRAEEQRISCLRQTEEARQALVEAERHCREMENKNSLLEGQVCTAETMCHSRTSDNRHIETNHCVHKIERFVQKGI